MGTKISITGWMIHFTASPMASLVASMASVLKISLHHWMTQRTWCPLKTSNAWRCLATSQRARMEIMWSQKMLSVFRWLPLSRLPSTSATPMSCPVWSTTSRPRWRSRRTRSPCLREEVGVKDRRRPAWWKANGLLKKTGKSFPSFLFRISYWLLIHEYMLQIADKSGGAAWIEEVVSHSSDAAWKNRKAMQRKMAQPSEAKHQGFTYTLICIIRSNILLWSLFFSMTHPST